LSLRKDPRTEQRPTLPHQIQHHDPHPPPRITPLIIQDPRQDIRSRGKDAACGQENRKVFGCDLVGRAAGDDGEDEVAKGGEEGEECDGDAALAGAVGDVGGGEEGDEVGGCGEALGVDGGEAHGVEDGGEEDGQGGEGDVAGEVHELWMV